MEKKREAVKEFEKLIKIVEKLGGPGGCPWDRRQTFKSLRPCLVEETCEVLEAIDTSNMRRLKVELGDLLYIILFLARLADKRSSFRLYEVLGGISSKLVRRHPAIFSTKRRISTSEAGRLWHESKRLERETSKRNSILDGIPPPLPALHKARKVQRRAAKVGFDWPSLLELLPKLEEETLEFLNSLKSRKRKEAAEELGDLLFTLVNISRFLELDPELALEEATVKFSRRFRKMEKIFEKRGLQLGKLPLEEMDRVWNEIKWKEHKG